MTCTHSHIEVDVYTRHERFDPTRTTSLRNAWVREMNRRFRRLRGLINKAIVDQDCFGDMTEHMAPARKAFAFPRTADKVSGFMDWLDKQVKEEILEVSNINQVGRSIDGAWTNKYINDSYKRGVIRSRYELRKAKFDVPSLESTGGIDASMSTPFHADRVGALYTRAFSKLKGITDAMDNQISEVLGQGLIDGDHPRLLARKLNSVISGKARQTLGITDTLGRAISPERRARMLARTEIIRAHHQAVVQEYENWKVEGVEVVAEWITAGYNVCPECDELAMGGPYKIEEVRNMIPAHPNCFIDPQVPIYTSEGWKPIGKIEVGDLVLTHKKRFRKVTALIRTPRQSPKVTKFTFDSDKTLTVTDNHPILKGTENGKIGRWKEAKDINIGDNLMFLGNTCKRCGKIIPYFQKYCSYSCNSKDITDKQWNDPVHRKNISEKNSKSMLEQYRLGLRDKDTIAKKANEKTRQLVKLGLHPFQRLDVIENNKKVTNTPKHKKASSERMKRNNPMINPATKAKMVISLNDYLENHPEQRLNARMAKHRKGGRKTSIEARMALLLDKLGINYVFQYPILRYDVDFAIPELKIAIECDGEYWHQDKKRDKERQSKIEKEGWFVLRYSETKINQCLNEIEDELARVVGNHTGEYNTLGMQVKKIGRWKLKKARTLYNFSVDEDESYIAKGVVVHNCRCTTIPVKMEKKVKQ
jgi:very-short-patch-repair endonuclease